MAPPHALLGRRPFVLGLASMALPRLSRAQTATPLSVRIEEPGGGVLTAQDTARLVATVSDPSVLTASITVHGMSYEVPVRDGRVEQTVVVLPGTNRVGVGVRRGEAVARDSVTFHVDGDPVDLVVLLGWSARGDHRPLGAGARRRDRQVGPPREHPRRTPPGLLLRRHRLRLPGLPPRPRLRGALPREGPLLVRRSAPRPGRLRLRAGPRTPPRHRRAPPRHAASLRVRRPRRRARRGHRPPRRLGPPLRGADPLHAEVLLFANTPRERRWRFDLTAQRSGQLQTLGEVEVTSAMLLDARRTLP